MQVELQQAAKAATELKCQRNHWDVELGQYYFDGAGSVCARGYLFVIPCQLTQAFGRRAMLPRTAVDAGLGLIESLSRPWMVPGQIPSK